MLHQRIMLTQTNAFTTAGGVESGDTLPLGTDTNMLSFSSPDSGLPVPVKIKTDGGFAILINQLLICDFIQDEILCSQPIDIDQHSIKNVMNPVNKVDAVN